MIKFNNKEFIKLSTTKVTYSLALGGTELINFAMINSNIKPFSEINSTNLNIIEEQLSKKKSCKILIKFRRNADPAQPDFVYSSGTFCSMLSNNPIDIITKEASSLVVIRMITDTYQGTALVKANTILLENGKVNVYFDDGSPDLTPVHQGDSFTMTSQMVYNNSGGTVLRNETTFVDFYVAEEDLVEMMNSDLELLTNKISESLGLVDSLKTFETNQESLLIKSQGLEDLIVGAENRLDSNAQQITSVANRVDALMYQLDSTKNIVTFLADKIAEEKAQILSLQSSVSSSALALTNAIDQVDKEQGSNYIKLEDMSTSIQGINHALSLLTTLPSRIEASLSMDENIIDAIENIRNSLTQLDQKPQDNDISKSDKMLISVTIINLLLQIITMATRKEKI